MSAVFGGLFFIIILLMGFNVMLWGFIQYDSYNTVITTMAQRDQQAGDRHEAHDEHDQLGEDPHLGPEMT